MKRCYDCQNFVNLTRKQTGGGIDLTRDAFVGWKRESSDRRRCAYCGLSAEELYELKILNPRNKRQYESIGVDRRDNSLPYRLDNLIPCCGPCNAIKGGVLTESEMRELGGALRKIWLARLATAAASGVDAGRVS